MAAEGRIADGLVFEDDAASASVVNALRDVRTEAAYAEALRSTRDGLRGVELERCLRHLAACLGTRNAKPSAIRSLTAVLEQEVWPEWYKRDEDCWTAHRASRGNFQAWRRKVRAIHAPPPAGPSPTSSEEAALVPVEDGWMAREACLEDARSMSPPPTDGIDEPQLCLSIEDIDSAFLCAVIGDSADEAAPTGGGEASHERTSDNSESSEGPPPSEADAAAPNTSLAADASAGKTEARAASDPGACQSCESAMPAAADEQPPPTRVERAPAVSAAAPCARPGCACVSFDGHAGHFCCRTCRGTPTAPGRACGPPRDGGVAVHPRPSCAPATPAVPHEGAEGDPPASAPFGFARCARAECRCSASFDGQPGNFCCITCRDGVPCDGDYHPKPQRRSRKGKRA